MGSALHFASTGLTLSLDRPKSNAAGRATEPAPIADTSVQDKAPSPLADPPMSEASTCDSSSLPVSNTELERKWRAWEKVTVEAMIASNHPLAPITQGPPRVPEPQWRRENALQNYSAEKVPVEDVLEAFPNRVSWRRVMDAATGAGQWHKKKILHHMLWLSLEKKMAMPETTQRADLLLHGVFPYTALPEEVKQAQWDWLAWIVNLDKLIAHGLRQVNWITLLEREYAAAETIWERFWSLHEENEIEKAKSMPSHTLMPPRSLQNDLDVACRDIAWHNLRRAWLQKKIMDGTLELNMGLFAPMPTWYAWPQVVPQPFQAGVHGESYDDEERGEYEGGFVEALDDDFEDEDKDDETSELVAADYL